EYQVELVSGLDQVAKPRGKRPTGKLCNWPGCNDLHAVSPSVPSDDLSTHPPCVWQVAAVAVAKSQVLEIYVLVLRKLLASLAEKVAPVTSSVQFLDARADSEVGR